MSPPTLRDVVFWTLWSVVELTNASVPGAARISLGHTCSSLWPNIQEPIPRAPWLTFSCSTGKPGMLWESLMQPGPSALPDLRADPRWVQGSRCSDAQLQDSAWSSTRLSASKLTQESTDCKAWSRSNLVLRSSAKMASPGLVSGQTAGVQFSWRQTCEQGAYRWTWTLKDRDPKKQSTWCATKILITPMLLGSLHQTAVLKDRYGGLTCARITHRIGTGILPGHLHAFITSKMTQNLAGYLSDISGSSKNFWPAYKNMLQLLFYIIFYLYLLFMKKKTTSN